MNNQFKGFVMNYLLFFGLVLKVTGSLFAMNGPHQSPQPNCTQCIIDLCQNKNEFEAYQLLRRFDAELYDINTTQGVEASLLHYYVKKQMRTYFFKTLLAKGADKELANSAGEMPLIVALRFFNHDGARMLVSAGARVDIQDSAGKTPLHWLCINQPYLRELGLAFERERRANVGGQSDSYLRLAQSLIPLSVPLLKELAIKRLIMPAPNMQLIGSLIPELKIEVLYYILQVNKRFDQSLLALVEHDPFLITLLMQRIKSVCRQDDFINKKDNDGNTPLHLVARSHVHVLFALYLVRAGADRLAQNNARQTPLDVARHTYCDRRTCLYCDELQEYLAQPFNLLDTLEKMLHKSKIGKE